MAASEPRTATLDRHRWSTIDGVDVRFDEPLAGHSTFRIGGPVDGFAEIETEAALVEALDLSRRDGVPFVILGLGSNVLFPDRGLSGVVARLSGDFLRFEIDGERVTAGAALPLAQVAKRTAQAGLTGLEALSGFPSTVGGAVYMNAGCYGTEMRDVLVAATLVDRDGRRRRVLTAALEPAYRRTNLEGTGTIVTGAEFELAPGDAAASMARIEELNRKRWASLPSGVPNAGSIFKNPEGDYAGRLIDACGLKGRRRGGAQISERHGNVIVNLGGARADEVLELMIDARREVDRRFGIHLEPELVLTGELADRWRRET